ncbi:type II secretion system protein [Thermopirellula anaerolimosa]
MSRCVSCRRDGRVGRGSIPFARSGFTLVEMLTVIVIIGILAGLISAAAIYARARAREAAIYTQIKQLEASLMQYKNEYGEFPPDFWGWNGGEGPAAQAKAEQDLRRHLRKRWPKYAAGADPIVQFAADLTAAGLDPTKLDPASALVFWLGGLPEEAPSGVWKPAGFHADEEHPFQYGQPRTGPMFEFDPKKITNDAVGILRYYMEGPTSSPVVYFRAQRDANNGRFEYGLISGGAFQPMKYVHFSDADPDPKANRSNIAVPYLDGDPQLGAPADPAQAASKRNWRNPETFQIIHPGLDGVFGNGRDSSGNVVSFRFTISGQGFSADGGDFDNITNFAPKLESEIQ